MSIFTTPRVARVDFHPCIVTKEDLTIVLPLSLIRQKKRFVSGNMGRKCRVGRSDFLSFLKNFLNMKIPAGRSKNPKIDRKRVKIQKFLQNCIKKRRVGPNLIGSVGLPETNLIFLLA